MGSLKNKNRQLLTEIKHFMVRTENYLLWLMIAVMAVVAIYTVWEGANTYQKLNRIISSRHIAENETELHLLNLKLTVIQDEDPQNSLKYVTVTGLSYSLDPEQKLEKIRNSDIDTEISGMEYNPSFLLKNEHAPFWKEKFIWSFVLYYGGMIAFILLIMAFGYINLKQDYKLLTKEIEKIFQIAFFLALAGCLAYQFLNRQIIDFLNSEFQMNESAGALASNEIFFIVLAMLTGYIVIARAVPVQKDQDLTV